jgi:hypothetical protein
VLSLRLSCSGLRALDGEEVFTGLFALEFIHVPVVSVPTAQVQRDPALQNYPNVPGVLTKIAKLPCDIYDSAVALVN